MRELPFKVWNARRSVVSSSRSSGIERSWALAALADSTTSRASSRKTSRISSSCSKFSISVIGAIGVSGTGALTGAKPAGSVDVATKSTSASESSPRALATSTSSRALLNASCAFSTAAARAG